MLVSIYVRHHRIRKPAFLKRGSWNIRKRRIVVFAWTNKNGGFGIQLRHTSYSTRMHHFNLIRLDGEKSI